MSKPKYAVLNESNSIGIIFEITNKTLVYLNNNYDSNIDINFPVEIYNLDTMNKNDIDLKQVIGKMISERNENKDGEYTLLGFKTCCGLITKTGENLDYVAQEGLALVNSDFDLTFSENEEVIYVGAIDLLEVIFEGLDN